MIPTETNNKELHHSTLSHDPLLTSIIIPAHNCWDLTEACVASIDQCTYAPYEIILIDDASDPETAEKMKALECDHIRIIRNETRRSFSENNNAGARIARGKYLCLLNNDTYVTPRWLSAMVKVCEHEPSIGVLGNKHLFPDSDLLHHCGMGIDDDGHPLHLHPHTNPDEPAVNYQRDFQMVTFACVLIPSAVYNQLNGLDETFRNGYEDCDFCLRAREQDLRVTYTPASIIYHHGQATPGRKDTDSANWKRFQEIWGQMLKKDLMPLTQKDLAYNASLKHVHPQPEPGLHFAIDFSLPNAFTWATVDLITALLEKGERISIPRGSITHHGIPKEKREVLRGLMKDRPYGTFHVKWSHYWPQYMKQPLYGEVNAEFFCTNYRYRKDTQLDFWSRHLQVNGIHKLPVSRFNQEALGDFGFQANDCPIVPLGYSPEITSLFPHGREHASTESDKIHILIVTNSNDLYRYGTDLAIDALAQAYTPDDPVVIHIKDYGASSGNPQLKQWLDEQTQFPDVVWHNEFLSKEDLLKLYASMDILLAPFRGEGFSMKILDAMAIGVPVMMPFFGGPTEFAAENTFIPITYKQVDVGECYDRNNYYLGDGAWWCEVSVDDFVLQLKKLLSSKDYLHKIGVAAREHVIHSYAWSHAADALMSALRNLYYERTMTVVPRRQPSTTTLTVLIPTKDRPSALKKTLDAYAEQTLSTDTFELLLVNDHGDFSEVETLCKKYADTLPIRLIDNHGKGGPAAARNLGIEHARGDIILITGDDIIPDKHFLEEHVNAHKKFPEQETAFVGKTHWHPDLPVTPFHEYIDGKGGHQFNYQGMKHQKKTLFNRFYTSNCSLKRAFLVESNPLFSTAYRYAACEDIELAYRLHLRGMELRFWEKAHGYHLHEMTPQSFIQRQYKVGQMLTLFAIQHPAFMPDEHMGFIRALEFMRTQPGLVENTTSPLPLEKSLLDSMLAGYESMLALNQTLTEPLSHPLQNRDREKWQQWFHDTTGLTWEALNELTLRLGMAEEWCIDEQYEEHARRWTLLITLPRILGPTSYYWRMPFVAPSPAVALFPRSKCVFWLSQFLRNTPALGHAVKRIEDSRMGKMGRQVLMRIIKRK